MLNSMYSRRKIVSVKIILQCKFIFNILSLRNILSGNILIICIPMIFYFWHRAFFNRQHSTGKVPRNKNTLTLLYNIRTNCRIFY